MLSEIILGVREYINYINILLHFLEGLANYGFVYDFTKTLMKLTINVQILTSMTMSNRMLRFEIKKNQTNN